MKIEKINIKKIIPYENNAKLHPKEQIDQIKASIQEFGFNDPIAIDEKNIVIEGHGRLLALQELDFKEVEVIRLKHFTEIQKKKYILFHNKSTMNTGFDQDILRLELDAIKLEDDDLELTGFSLEETEEILLDLETEEEENKIIKQPEDFKEYTEDIKTEFCCPKCKYTWSGKANG